MNALAFDRNGLAVSTRGMTKRGLPEMRVQVSTPSLLLEAERFLQFVADYLGGSDKKIRDGETLSYGYWLVKFRATNDGFLDVWEYNAEATQFVRGGSLTLSYWRDQNEVCASKGAAFCPPRADKLTAVAAGVFEGLAVEGVRYPMGAHMSGWFLFTDKWDKNIKSLTNHHTYHVTAARPDLARFLALPIGFRFETATNRVWLDEEVAHQAFQSAASGIPEEQSEKD